MKVNEIFYSLQGEGRLTGTPSVFVRLAGCPLRCRWCDTKYAWEGSAGRDYGVKQIVEEVRKYSCKFVVITGGEPMVQPDLPQLLKILADSDSHITVETAGIVFVPGLSCNLMSISPKLSNSVPSEPELARAHNKARVNVTALRQLTNNYECQLKFVVESGADLAEIEGTLAKIGDACSDCVMLMPQAATREEFLSKSEMVAELCKRSGFLFCQRLQLLLWDNEKGV